MIASTGSLSRFFSAIPSRIFRTKALPRLQGLGDVLDQDGELGVPEDLDDDPPPHRPEAEDRRPA